MINKNFKFTKQLVSYAAFISGILGASISGYAAQVIHPLKEPLTQSPSFNWAGPYLGGYVGGAWGHSNFYTTVSQTYFQNDFQSASSVAQYGSIPLNPNAFTGGVQAGDNWTLDSNLGQFIYGFALDYGSFAMSKTNTVEAQYASNPNYLYTIQTSLKTEWLFTARGRAGLAARASWPLIYATGGLAVTSLQVGNFYADNSLNSNGNRYLVLGNAYNSATKSGWTAGGGVEFPISDRFTVNAEYLYLDFGSVTVADIIVGAAGVKVSSFITSANLTANTFKVGVNYKFA